MNIQYKKGILDICVLSMLSEKDCYGYEISDFISRHLEISDGTIYPILRKLKQEGFLQTYLSEDSGGPPRKYYSLTSSGKLYFERSHAEWISFIKSVNQILKGEKNEQN